MNTQYKKVCVIIPAYNEEGSIGTVIDNIRYFVPAAQLVVVNDASSDGTRKVAELKGVPVLDLPINLGIGGAMQTGFKYAYRYGYEIAMQVDADGQHDPQFIPDLLRVLEDGEVDMVIGSRFLKPIGYKASFLRLFGIRLFAWLIGIVTNKRVYDSTSGYRAYNRLALEFVARHYPSDFPEPESIVTMLRNGFRLKEVMVVMVNRLSGQSSLGKDLGFRAAYFLISNAIAIVMSGFKAPSR
ncbi:MAG: glycosyltransferase family 2 protein [Candidatus Andersenbacteria bacterium]